MNVPGEGYVGVGIVEEPAKQIKEFAVIDSAGERIPILKAPLASQGICNNSSDPEQGEVMVRVRWLNAVPLSEACSERGFFGNQNTVARPTSQKWNFTIDRLKERFKIAG